MPSVDDQLHELALEQNQEFPVRTVEQRTRRSLNRYVADLPKGAYIDQLSKTADSCGRITIDC